jgi:hypothetical protein
MAERYGLKKFEDLKTSTSTIMIYTNLRFDTKEIFSSLEITSWPWNLDGGEIPLTKKQKNVDKKKILSPYGTIISVQSKTRIRGIDMRKKKRHWCTVCRPYKIFPQGGGGIEKETKMFTVTEYLVNEVPGLQTSGNIVLTDIDLNDPPEDVPSDSGASPSDSGASPSDSGASDVWAIKYYCSKCQRSYDPGEMKKINHFLNQLTIVLSVGKYPMLNIMMFKDNLKIAGCKSVDDAAEALMILWQDYIVKKPHLWKLKKGATTPRFQFQVVMKNVDFKFGFPIERNELNVLMNDPIYSDKVFMSQYEPTGQTNVNIKMHSVKPDGFKYDCLVIPLEGNPYFVAVSELTYKNPKKKTKGGKYITFIIFSSSEVILSGRYDGNMKEMYEFLVDVVMTHKNQIQEVIYNPNQLELTKIRKT